jgi:TM2 domain-containing membrane protein YozV
MTRAFVFFCCILFSCFTLHAQTDYYSPAAIREFADWLFAQGDYARAASEYLKVFVVEQEKAEESLAMATRSFLLAGDFISCEKYLILFMERYKESDRFDNVLFDLAFVCFRMERYNDSSRVLACLGQDSPAFCYKALLLEASNLCATGLWAPAIALLGKRGADATSEFSGIGSALEDLAREAVTADRKSPVAAAVFSAMVPGLGKIYADRPEDGLFSFISTGIFTGLAAWSFYEDGAGSVRGWIYASVGSIFYAGNIYGSVMAALNHDRDADERYKKEAVSIGGRLMQ